MEFKLNEAQAKKLVKVLINDCYEINGNYSFTEIERVDMIEDNNDLIKLLGGAKYGV